MREPLSPEMFAPMCPSSAFPIQIGGKWTGMVIRCLERAPRRFTELRKALPAVTPKVLSETLRSMERDGLLTRSVHDENSPRVEYELTDLGRSLLDLIEASRAWASENFHTLLKARDEHDLDSSP